MATHYRPQIEYTWEVSFSLTLCLSLQQPSILFRPRLRGPHDTRHLVYLSDHSTLINISTRGTNLSWSTFSISFMAGPTIQLNRCQKAHRSYLATVSLSVGTKATVFYLFYLGFLRRFQHCTGHITTGSWKGRGNQYIEFTRVLYCKLPTNGKQLPAFPHKALTGIEPRPQRWEARVLPLCHHGPPKPQ